MRSCSTLEAVFTYLKSTDNGRAGAGVGTGETNNFHTLVTTPINSYYCYCAVILLATYELTDYAICIASPTLDAGSIAIKYLIRNYQQYSQSGWQVYTQQE